MDFSFISYPPYSNCQCPLSETSKDKENNETVVSLDDVVINGDKLMENYAKKHGVADFSRSADAIFCAKRGDEENLVVVEFKNSDKQMGKYDNETIRDKFLNTVFILQDLVELKHNEVRSCVVLILVKTKPTSEKKFMRNYVSDKGDEIGKEIGKKLEKYCCQKFQWMSPEDFEKKFKAEYHPF